MRQGTCPRAMREAIKRRAAARGQQPSVLVQEALQQWLTAREKQDGTRRWRGGKTKEHPQHPRHNHQHGGGAMWIFSIILSVVIMGGAASEATLPAPQKCAGRRQRQTSLQR
jgi:hypothetical protein